MSIFVYFIKAWIIGIVIAAPVGPIGMLCIKKTLEIGLRGTIAVGLGAALADGVYGGIAALGISSISNFLLERESLIKMIGGVFLLFLAYKEFKSSPASKEIIIRNHGILKTAVEVFFLTLVNPVTILTFIGVFSSIGNGPVSLIESSVMMMGIFLGSMTWWFILGALILKFKEKLPESWIVRIKYLSVIALGLFGLLAVFSA